MTIIELLESVGGLTEVVWTHTTGAEARIESKTADGLLVVESPLERKLWTVDDFLRDFRLPPRQGSSR